MVSVCTRYKFQLPCDDINNHQNKLLQEHVGAEFRDISLAVGRFIRADLFAKNISYCEKVSESICKFIYILCFNKPSS